MALSTPTSLMIFVLSVCEVGIELSEIKLPLSQDILSCNYGNIRTPLK